MSKEERRNELIEPYGSLAATVNRMWRDAYGDQCAEVTDEKALCLRVEKLAEDRKCWIFNARQSQKEYSRLEKLLSANNPASDA